MSKFKLSRVYCISEIHVQIQKKCKYQFSKLGIHEIKFGDIAFMYIYTISHIGHIMTGI